MEYLNDLIQTPLEILLTPFKRFHHHHHHPPHAPQPQPQFVPQTVACPNSMAAIIRLAGLSGASAVILGAYGSHVLRDQVDERRQRAFDTGSRYHLLHSVALLGARQARHPLLTALLFSAGIILFCGPCYHYSITGEEKLRKFTPTGGILFILGWLSFIL